MSQFSINLGSSLSDALSFKSLAWLNQLRDDRFVKFSATASQQNRYTEEDHWGALAALTYAPEVSFAKSLSVEVGASVEEQDNISKRFNTVLRVPTAQTRDQAFTLSVKGLYAQADIELNDWLKIVPAWRVDWVDGDFVNRLINARAGINEYGAIQQPKLSIAATPMENVTLYANWGRTFQIGVGSGAYLIPPRLVDLEPSTNEGWEAGIRYAPDANTELRAAIWKQTATGEIKRRLNDPLGDFDNLGATERDGVDVQASTSPIDGLSLWGAIAWQRAEITRPDPATPALAGKAIDHVPNWLYNAGIDYQVTPELTLSASARAQTSYELTTSNNRGRFGDFVLLNASASYALTPGAEAGLEIQNIGDEYYEYVWWDGAQTLHSPGEGRAVIASLRLRN
jgi:iron complex outermembrane receptor protein